ncbi:VWA domain-containing protein [Occallatibacter savannae]|uniref:VWA domain-containing protein n=1 Tax=Occallatibacter savannae TaxID=1002691 RepID=UPI0013A53A2D|nr:VWA domain-containing protein [Occallatibacter savannae]
MSVSQLETILAKAGAEPDNGLASRLSALELTERFSTTRLQHWTPSLPGARSVRALIGLADRSAFLSPPQEELAATAVPDIAEQRRIMNLVAKYVGKSIPQLPRFYASRTVTHFEDDPSATRSGSWADTDSLRPVRISRNAVLYRNGEEVVEPGLFKVNAQIPEAAKSNEAGLRTWGTFGPILGLVLVDAAQNKLSFARWERAGSGNAAVFRYEVPKARSHYEVRYCCVASSFGLESKPFSEMSAYRGEIAVDPATGVIERLSIEAELEKGEPISRAALVVEYGPVELGGSIYVCPTRSVSISLAQTLRKTQDSTGRSWTVMGPEQLLLNDVSFSQYHLFRSDARLLSADEERAAGLAPDATLPQPDPAEMLPAEEELSDSAKPSAAVVAASSDQATPAPEGDTQEISTAKAARLPDRPEQIPDPNADGPQSAEATLRVNTRLVDVNVVALDKKGHPITDLRPQDFEVYDNGVTQDVRSFMQTTAEAVPKQAAASSTPFKAEFSNHAAPDLQARTQESSVVLLIDPSNLSFGDFTDARQQMLRFLRTVAPSERVALYVMRYHSYLVLHEATTDHEALAEQLAHWKPDGQDVANAQDEEKRNRQQIETVRSPEDHLSVNGNYTMDSATQQEAQDPKLRELGSRPGPNALGLLVEVAHHLAAVPGHKNLIWVTSDNALADWNKLSYNIDKGSKYIEPIALRAQEALNNAHVSIYPLDASRLEANVVTADIGRRNVELTPTYQRPPFLERELEGTEEKAGVDTNPLIQNRNFGNGSRLAASLEQDIHSIQGVFREVADATGGHTFRRSGNIIGELNAVVADGHATYLLGFSPSQPADNQYHMLTVKLVGHRDATLRFRSGYQYDREAANLKERFAQTVWQPVDASEIGVTAKLVSDTEGEALRVTVAGSDLALKQQNAVWAGKLDIFLVQRDQESLRAKVSGLTVGLHLKPNTYQRAMTQGLTFDQRIESKQMEGSLRVVVVDVTSGRIGSITVPSRALVAAR